MTPDVLSALLLRVGREAAYVVTDARTHPVSRPASVAEVRAAVARAFTLDQATAPEVVVERVIDLLRSHTLHVTHPRHFGLFNPSVHDITVVADALVALFNPQVGGWLHAPAACELERLALRHVSAALGLPAHTSAQFTSGGNEANHTAVLCALAARYPEWGSTGVRSLKTIPALYLSEAAHHSFVKVARATGIGTDAIRSVPVDEALRMDTGALRRLMLEDRQRGLDPFLIVATAGTTGSGAIDPLPDVADIARETRTWYHVDAAWGGAAALSPRLRGHLGGLERADSVTCDAHKWLSVPVGAGIFFTTRPEVLPKAFGVETSYIPPTTEGVDDLYRTSMQWSRRFIGLKLLMSLAHLGAAGMAAHLEHQAAMGDALRGALDAAGWKCVNRTPFPLVCARHADLPEDREGCEAFVSRIVARGRVWLSAVGLPGQGWAIRACITSIHTTESDLAVLVEELEHERLALRGVTGAFT